MAAAAAAEAAYFVDPAFETRSMHCKHSCKLCKSLLVSQRGSPLSDVTDELGSVLVAMLHPDPQQRSRYPYCCALVFPALLQPRLHSHVLKQRCEESD